MPTSNPIRHAGRAVATAVLAVAVTAIAVSPAGAGVLVKSAPSCTGQTVSKPFMPWNDKADYTLSPGGAFEAGQVDWTLQGAEVKAGNEPFLVRGQGDQRSLELSPGDSATSPTMCVGLEHPTLRFFAKGQRKLLSTLTVEVIAETSLGLQVALPVGVVLPSGAWQPSPAYLVVGNLLPLLPGQYTPVRFRLRAIGGTWNVDDFFVDPKRRA